MARSVELRGQNAAPPPPRRFSGKPIALALAAFLIVGTALSTYFAWRAEVQRQRAQDLIEANQPPPAP